LNRPSTERNGQPAIPQDPLFSPAALTFRPGSRITANFYCFWARNAIFHGLRALGIRRGEKILVPAYLCTAAVEPIEHFGAEVEFYAIHRNCEPDWEDLEAKVRCNVRAVMAVHYFGFPCDIQKFCALRERYGVFLIEDCAHVLDGIPNNPHQLGQWGDFSVFSPRKFVAVFDGGTLRLNRSAPGFHVRFQFEDPLFTLREAKNLFERRKPPPAPLEPQGEEAQQKHRELCRPERPRYVFPNDTAFLPWMADFPMSRLSRSLLPHFRLSEIASKRRSNFAALLERLAPVEGVRPVCDGLAPGVIPWVLPVTIGEGPGAHKSLRALGVPAVTWGEVRDRRILARDFPDADFLYEHLIFLPIHQDLEAAHLEAIADAVVTVCRAGPLSLPNPR